MLPVVVEVGLALFREIGRAVLFPLRCAWYLPWHKRHQDRSRELLAQGHATSSQDDLSLLLQRQPPTKRTDPHVFLSAGEPSGEAHAVHLLQAVDEDAARAGTPVRWSCFGGEPLVSAGARLVMPLSEHAIMGFIGVLRAAPIVIRAYARFLRLLRDDRPDLVVLVDYPGLHLVMAGAARRCGITVIHYVAPQHWAWAPWRMRRYRRNVDACLTILPFEVALFRSHGVACEYVGHPLLDQRAAEPPSRAKVAALRVDRVLCLLPGSRGAEIDLHLPGMLDVARRMRERHPQLRVLVAHNNPRRAAQIRAWLQRENVDGVEFELGDLAEKLASAQVVLAKSGTGSLEATLFGTPTVVVYKVRARFMMFLYRRFLTVPWFAAANLISARTVVPERCFHGDDGWDWALEQVDSLYRHTDARQHCLDQLADVQRRLGEPGASGRAARWVTAALGLPIPTQ